MKKLLILLALLLTTACTPVESPILETTEPPAEEQTPSLEPADPIGEETEDVIIPPVEKIRKAVAEMLGISDQDISVVEVQSVTFRDSCLEMGQANESCLAALTPGYRVQFQIMEETAWYHLPEDGSYFREATAEFTPMPGENE